MTKTKTWKRTIAAAKAEQGSAWTMILAYADEAYERDPTYKDATSGLTIHELQKELLEEGVDLAHTTLKGRAVTGIHVHAATADDREVLTSVGWTIVREFANRSYSPEASAQAIRDCRADGQAPTLAWARRIFEYPGRTSEPHVITDDDAFKSAGAVFRQKLAADRDEWTPSAMTRLLWQMVAEVLAGRPIPAIPADLDKELEKLLAAEGGHG